MLAVVALLHDSDANQPACCFMLCLQSGKGVIKVSVKDASGGAVPGAEVTLLVVDKAVLDLMPYALQVAFPSCRWHLLQFECFVAVVVHDVLNEIWSVVGLAGCWLADHPEPHCLLRCGCAALTPLSSWLLHLSCAVFGGVPAL
jgi:hypothetical protein